MVLKLTHLESEDAFPMREEEAIAVDIINAAALTPITSPSNIDEATKQCNLILDKLMDEARAMAKTRDQFLDIAHCLLEEFRSRQIQFDEVSKDNRGSASSLMRIITAFYWSDLLKIEGESLFSETYQKMRQSKEPSLYDPVTLIDVDVTPSGLPLQDEVEKLEMELKTLSGEKTREQIERIKEEEPELYAAYKLYQSVKIALLDIKLLYCMQNCARSKLRFFINF